MTTLTCLDPCGRKQQPTDALPNFEVAQGEGREMFIIRMIPVGDQNTRKSWLTFCMIQGVDKSYKLSQRNDNSLIVQKKEKILIYQKQYAYQLFAINMQEINKLFCRKTVHGSARLNKIDADVFSEMEKR